MGLWRWMTAAVAFTDGWCFYLSASWPQQEMWKEYHRERKDALADSIPAGQFDLLRERAKPW
jgi:hypothetical protein